MYRGPEFVTRATFVTNFLHQFAVVLRVLGHESASSVAPNSRKVGNILSELSPLSTLSIAYEKCYEFAFRYEFYVALRARKTRPYLRREFVCTEAPNS